MVQIKYTGFLSGALNFNDNKLRHALANIKTRDGSKALFHTVEETWDGDAVNFWVHPNHEKEAASVVPGILAYLKYTSDKEYHKRIERYFTMDKAF